MGEPAGVRSLVIVLGDQLDLHAAASDGHESEHDVVWSHGEQTVHCHRPRYIERMGCPCAGCRYDPAVRVGEGACPFTTLYRDFMMRHEDLLAANQRMRWQLSHLSTFAEAERLAMRQRAEAIRAGHVGASASGR